MAVISRFKIAGPERIGNGRIASSKTVERGTICAFDADGLVQEANDTASWHFAGIAKHRAGDTGEPTTVELDYGTPFFYADASAVQADVGSTIYVSGAGTLGKTSVNSVKAGTVVDVEAGSGWWIDPLWR